MALSTADKNWIKSRLPSDAAFTKNGVTQTSDDVITASEGDNTADYTVAKALREAVLGDLWEIVESETTKQKESEGDYSYEILKQNRSDYWHSQAAATQNASTRGAFSFPAASYQSAAGSDEFSQ
jgi:hypothetical protein